MEKEGIGWMEWGLEAFRLAREQGKPILLDIGAVWCHWCHVMDEKCYEDPRIIERINRDYVPVRVDADRRPEINARYNQGGWPTTAILSEEGVILLGATYVPPDSLMRILDEMRAYYETNRAAISKEAETIERRRRLEEKKPSLKPSGSLDWSIVEGMQKTLLYQFDPVFGGFGGAPKFPQPDALSFAVSEYERTNDSTILSMIERTLGAMGTSGTNDHIGGGFHRYSVTADWRIPHFEKLLRDNAELLRVYLETYLLTGRSSWRDVAEGILAFAGNDLLQEDGSFYGSQDADIGSGDDGSFYTWTKKEVEKVMGSNEARAAIIFFGLEDSRNAMPEDPERHVLHISSTLSELSERLGMSEPEARSLRDASVRALRQARKLRRKPSVDGTIFVDQNAQMAQAYFLAAEVLDRGDLAEMALETLDFLLAFARTRIADSGEGLAHYITGGTAHATAQGGLLSDQVHTASACLAAFMSSGDWKYLEQAEELARLMLAHFSIGDGPLSDSSSQGPREGVGLLCLSEFPIVENAAAAELLVNLALLTENHTYRERAEKILLSFAKDYRRFGLAASAYARAVTTFLSEPLKLTVAGPKEDRRKGLIVAECRGLARLRKIILQVDQKTHPERAKALGIPENAIALYPCLGTKCLAPILEPEEVSTRINDALLGKPAEGPKLLS